MKNRYFYKAIILLSSLLFPVVVSAEDYYGDEGLLGETALREADSNSPKGITHFAGWGAHAFYAETNYNPFKDSPDFYGLGLSYMLRQQCVNDEVQTLSSEFLISGLFGLGYGEVQFYSDTQYEIRHFMCTLAANLRYNVGSVVSLYVGARMGAEFLLFSMDDEDSTQDSDFGLTYGWGMGCSLAFSENFSMTLGVDCLTSEAEVDAGGYALPSVGYTIYSFGFNWIF